jgi:uncharacterized protein
MNISFSYVIGGRLIGVMTRFGVRSSLDLILDGNVMSGEMDLSILLRHMEPVLDAVPYGYGLIPVGAAMPDLDAFALVREAEGLTVVATAEVLDRAGIAYQGQWARISLQVHSDLAAVGLTAAIATELAKHGISANVVAGYFHDHVFVQWDMRTAAVIALKALSAGA